jgi:DNA invertase Pin-like site-specific DNA recombinase
MISQPKRLKSDSTPVCLYLRMSSDKQDKSIDDQRAELISYCAGKGYVIVREYADEGVSGWKSRERKGFQHLIAAAADGDFQLIICWDQSRFSRFEPVEFNYYVHQLKQAGVGIETIKEGRLDFDSLGGWLQANVAQHGKAEYVRSMAIDVARGQRRERAKGFWIGPRPYGYRLENRKLVLGSPEEVETIRRIFALRLQGYGIRRIAALLNSEGVKALRAAGGWHCRSVGKILQNTVLLGDTVIGKLSRPKFASKAEVKTIKNTHPAIIDRETFDAVQRLKGNPHNKTGKRRGSPLGGLLRCGCCGAPMYCDRRLNMYICGTYHSRGGCSHNKLDMSQGLRLIAASVRQNVLYGTLDRLTEVVEEELAKQAKATPKVDAANLRKQIAGIDAKLEAAAERLVSVAPSLVKTVEAKMLDLQRQREGLQERLQEQPKPRKQKSAKALAASLWRLDSVLRGNDADMIRSALHQLIDHVDVGFEAIPSKGKRIYHKPVSLSIHFTKTYTSSGKTSSFPGPIHAAVRRSCGA